MKKIKKKKGRKREKKGKKEEKGIKKHDIKKTIINKIK